MFFLTHTLPAVSTLVEVAILFIIVTTDSNYRDFFYSCVREIS